MSAVLAQPGLSFAAMTPEHLEQVLAIEAAAYPHPWTRGNFEDSLRAGYEARLLLDDGAIVGYFVAMKGVDEVHLLNITVAPASQRRGLAHLLLEALALWARQQGAQWLWLEVRVSNERAQQVYQRYGFQRVGQRKGYYPASHGVREDAIVMSLQL